ncbi:MAG: hypothetical protein HC866_05315 [Leptolyngbyaceae cyanobacterium RU_5_1]|nr:hypothetical protein [Leptolyngbyaceae cyanobacterium RU_5_1]
MKTGYSALTGISLSIIASALLLVLGTVKRAQAVSLTLRSSDQPIGYAENFLSRPALSQPADANRDREPEQSVCIGWDVLNISTNQFQGSCILVANALRLSEFSLFGESSLSYLSGISSKVVWSSSPSGTGKKQTVMGKNGYAQVDWETDPGYKTLMESKEPPSIIGIALLLGAIYGLRHLLKNLVGDE